MLGFRSYLAHFVPYKTRMCERLAVSGKQVVRSLCLVFKKGSSQRRSPKTIVALLPTPIEEKGR